MIWKAKNRSTYFIKVRTFLLSRPNPEAFLVGLSIKKIHTNISNAPIVTAIDIIVVESELPEKV